MNPLILKLDVTGSPSAWIRWQEAAVLYARDRVRWEAGEKVFTFRGGITRTGEQSRMDINSIIATDDRRNPLVDSKAGPSTLDLYRRDKVCLYCAKHLTPSTCTKEHIVAVSRGGEDTWLNTCAACVSCNQAKGNKTLEAMGWKLLAVPYRPNPAEMLLLLSSGRRITGCQQAWLESLASKGQRRH